ncbi:anthrone oxygenase family protein [Deminuibacter soli]|uniref:DUF1772 domain-containing protein n=1 Tax=Deminuibacter soli TaxID=2291815 RepID=A0A3E1NG90_9BACT|nr:anthrone oxygenase family protein [Deminuibacter soli]RFM26969.1 DUF1772 domain-containing protein [Deminuibacter soli]
MSLLHKLLLLATAVSTGLMAGLMYAWSCSVVPGITRLPDSGYISAMQSLNRAIQNPLFFASFFGALFLLPWCAWVFYREPDGIGYGYLFAAALVYAVGVMGVTIFGNIPLNKMLDAFPLQQASDADIAAQRRLFEMPWRNLHTVRTVSSFIALVLVVLAMLARYKTMLPDSH